MVPCVKQPTAMDGHKARVSLPFILDRQGRASVTRYLQTRLCRTHAMRHWLRGAWALGVDTLAGATALQWLSAHRSMPADPVTG
jgi:hypothetical protein